MSNVTNQSSNSTPNKSAGMRSEIGAKWDKLSSSDIAGLKSKDDLISMVQSKYSLDKATAQKDVNAFAKGRQL